jgi:DNA primase
MAQKELTQWVEDELLPTIFQKLDSAFVEFGWKKDGAKGWIASKNPFGVRADRVTCNRAYCFTIHGEGSRTWLSYVNEGTQPKGADYLKAVRDLAKRVGLIVPEKTETLESRERRENKEKERDLVEAVVKLCHKLLISSPEAQEARTYLEARGLPRDRWEVWELGFMPKEVSPILQEVERLGRKWEEGKAILLAAGLLQDMDRDGNPLNPPRLRLGGRVVAPWRGPGGSLLTWWGRKLPSAHPEAPKYLYAKDQPKTAPYLLDRLKGGRLLLVEGVLDAIACREHGFPAVALGGTSVAAHLPALKAHHPEDLTLTVDPDEAGEKAAPKIVAQLLEAGLSSVFVVELPKGDAGEKLDPDALLKTPKGPETLRRLVKEAPHALRWTAKAILAAHRGEGWTDKGITGAILEAVDFSAKLPAVLHPFITPNLLDELGQEIPLSPEAMLEATKVQHDRTELERHERETRVLLNETSKKVAKLLEEEKTLEARAVLMEDAALLKTQALKTSRPAPRVALEEWEELEAYLHALRGRERVGLAQDTLPGLDKALMGLRGLMLIAGPPGTGKTSLAVQLGMGCMEADEETAVVLLSLEQTRWEHLTRALAYHSGLSWETVAMGSEPCRNERDRQAGTHFQPFDLTALKMGEEKLRNLSGRFLILDGLNFPEPTAENLKDRTGASKALVIVDYLQLWPVPMEAAKVLRTDLDKDKWQIGELKKLRNLLGASDAVLAISEATKADWKTGLSMGSVMGSARGSYTPDVVMVLQPFSPEELAPTEDGEWKPTKEKEAKEEGEKLLNAFASMGLSIIHLQIVKGRDGVDRKRFALAFHYQSLRFEETTLERELAKVPRLP